jgi:AraC family transcriptional regulator
MRLDDGVLRCPQWWPAQPHVLHGSHRLARTQHSAVDGGDITTTSVPVTTGCIGFRGTDVGGFHVARIVFPPRLTLPLHSHPRATVAVILRGSFDGLTRSGSHPCPTGSMLTEPAGEAHGNRFAHAGATVFVVQPDPARAELLEPFAALLDRFDYQRDAFLSGLALRASGELNASDAVAPFALEGLVLELLATAARVRNPNGSRIGRRRPLWLDEARDLLHAGPDQQLRVGEIAALVGVHPVHLTRTFRAHYGMPVGAYLRNLRLEQAAHALADSTSSIADIAAQAGFYDQSHFGRTFKRQYGLTPHEYRRGAR